MAFPARAASEYCNSNDLVVGQDPFDCEEGVLAEKQNQNLGQQLGRSLNIYCNLSDAQSKASLVGVFGARASKPCPFRERENPP